MIVLLENENFSAAVDSVGAQLISLKDRSETEYIWQRDPAFWSSSSPLLFPSVGNCRGGRTRIEGAWYEMPKHGFCRGSEFNVKRLSGDCAVFSLSDSDATRDVYPYSFRLSLTYTLRDDGIFMDYRVENTDDKPISYLLGAHPGFRCPLRDGERFDDYALKFACEETASAMVYDCSKMQFDAGRRRPLLDHTHTLPLSYELFSDDAVFFDRLSSRSVELLNPATGNGVRVDFPDFETVAFWTAMPSRGPFLCIEPWNGSAIRSDEDDEFASRHFLQTLEVGERKNYHLGIHIL